MHINVNNSIQINYLDFELVNIIQDAKKETTYRIMYSHLGTQIHEVSKDTRLPLSHHKPSLFSIENPHREEPFNRSGIFQLGLRFQ